ncbi:MAG: P-type conjugative transfer ATPase TrbB [Acidobacteria bacterium]|nr:P-type conjugative transfer ATPase TrbB [Acidobacteriota bacterium]
MPEVGKDREQSDALRRYLGAGIVAALADEDVTEIYVNAGDGAVWLDRRGAGRVRSGMALSEPQVRSFLNAVANAQRVELTRDQPQLQAELPDDELFRQARLQGLVPPLSLAPVFVLRKPATQVWSLDEYVRQGVLGPAQRAALAQAVAARDNVLIAGGTRSGKTTLVNAVLHEITTLCPRDRVVILEDTRELQCAASDRLALRTTDEVDLAGLVRLTLRASPDRIVIGEVRDKAAMQLLDAWSTGHPGGVATVHATDAAGALERLDRLAQRNGVPPQAHLVAQAVDLVAVIVGGSQPRRVREMVRVTGLDRAGRYELEPIGGKSPGKHPGKGAARIAEEIAEKNPGAHPGRSSGRIAEKSPGEHPGKSAEPERIAGKIAEEIA